MITSPPEEEKTSSYEEIPYESHAFSQSHPERLAVLGKLFGMTPAPVDRCRVLELGCASGGNLIPMAFQLPKSEFVGVDSSRRHVEIAEKMIGGLGLTNIRITQGSILDIDPSWGTFDYILCHGVFSWVPDIVQEKILAVSQANLAHQGIAYISYNTYPGWHMRGMIREMMIYHTTQFADSVQKIKQARVLIDFLANSVPTKDYHYGLLLKSEMELIKKSQDYYLFHDHLESHNSPVYFHQFIERAERCGLQYLGEAEFSTMLTHNLPREVAKTLRVMSPSIIKSEQYMDFLRNRLFRQTLLCHKGVELKRNLGPANTEGLFFSSNAALENGPIDLTSGKEQSFRTPPGATFKISNPLTKAAFMTLKAYWPRAVDMDTLLEDGRRQLGVAELGPRDRRGLQADLLKRYSANIVEFHSWQADFNVNATPGIHPRLYPPAAYQLKERLPIVNQRHQTMKLDSVTRQIAPFLDGKMDRDALLSRMEKLVADGKLIIHETGKPLSDPGMVRELLVKALEKTLTNLAKTALLV